MSDISDDIIDMIISEIEDGEILPMIIKENNFDFTVAEARKAMRKSKGPKALREIMKKNRESNKVMLSRLKFILSNIKEKDGLTTEEINDYVYVLQETALELSSRLD